MTGSQASHWFVSVLHSWPAGHPFGLVSGQSRKSPQLSRTVPHCAPSSVHVTFGVTQVFVERSHTRGPPVPPSASVVGAHPPHIFTVPVQALVTGRSGRCNRCRRWRRGRTACRLRSPLPRRPPRLRIRRRRRRARPPGRDGAVTGAGVQARRPPSTRAHPIRGPAAHRGGCGRGDDAAAPPNRSQERPLVICARIRPPRPFGRSLPIRPSIRRTAHFVIMRTFRSQVYGNYCPLLER